MISPIIHRSNPPAVLAAIQIKKNLISDISINNLKDTNSETKGKYILKVKA